MVYYKVKLVFSAFMTFSWWSKTPGLRKYKQSWRWEWKTFWQLPPSPDQHNWVMSSPRFLEKNLLVKKRGGWHISSASVCQCERGRDKLCPADVFRDLRPNSGSCHLRSTPGPDPHPPSPAISYLFQLFFKCKLPSDACQRSHHGVIYFHSFASHQLLNVPSLRHTEWTQPLLHHTRTSLKMDPPTLQPAIGSQPPLSDSCWIRWYRRGRWRWRRWAVPAGWSHYETLTCGLYFIWWWAVRDAFAL